MTIDEIGAQELNREARIYFHDILREARAGALRDAEACEPLVHSIERLGAYLTSKKSNLNSYQPRLELIAERSPLAEAIPNRWRDMHRPVQTLFELVRHGRNSAMHDGVFARHLTQHLVELALILEDSLMRDLDQVGDYMVKNPVCAALWHPISFIRQEMLASSFSYLPVAIEDGAKKSWGLVSDLAVAQYLRSAQSGQERDGRLALPLKEAVGSKALMLDEPYVCKAGDRLATALERCQRLPILVCTDSGELSGILTAFDLL
ncbi:MAG: CBS domain-containing protein [bacterium]